MTSPGTDYAQPPQAVTQEPARRAGGLRQVPRGEMTPIFTILIALTFFDVTVMMAVPYLLTAGTDSLWQSPLRMGFLGASILSGLVFGLLAGVGAEQRGRSALWFLMGHLGAFAAPLLVLQGFAESSPVLARIVVFALGGLGTLATFAMIRRGNPETLSPVPAPLRILGRIFHAAGNIWLGITLLILLTSGIFLGGFWERWYGAKSAQYCVYTSPWFGILFLTFALSLISATFRKYPFKVSQAGWLTVHTSLVLLIIGAFMSFWGKKEGELFLPEGNKSAIFLLNTETRLVVEEIQHSGGDNVSRRRIHESIASFDRNPAQTEHDFRFTVKEGPEPLFEVSIDRYFANGSPRSGMDDGGLESRIGLSGTVNPPSSDDGIPLELVEGGDAQRLPMGANNFVIDLVRPPHAEAIAAMKSGRDAASKGVLRVTDKKGATVLSAKVEIVPSEPGSRRPAKLTLDQPIADTGLTLLGLGWFDNYTITETETGNTPIDLSPGKPYNPVAFVSIKGPKGDDRRAAIASSPGLFEERQQASLLYPDLEVHLDYFPVPPLTCYIVAEPDASLSYVYQSPSETTPRTGRLIRGEALDLGFPLQIRFDEIRTRHREWTTFDLVSFAPETQVVRAQIHNADTEPVPEHWLRLGDRGILVRKGARAFVVRWMKTEFPLGFELFLHEFHRDYYPGDTQPRTFESYLRLRHDQKFPQGADIKIDMNNPLRIDGWRLYQARFSSGDGEATILQVNRDPGLIVVYPACAILVLGLIVVFFQKPFLHALARALAGRSATVRFLAAVGTVIMAFCGAIPGLLIILLLPSGPGKGIGVIVILIGIVLETLWVMQRLRPRLLKEPATATLPAGAS